MYSLPSGLSSVVSSCLVLGECTSNVIQPVVLFPSTEGPTLLCSLMQTSLNLPLLLLFPVRQEKNLTFSHANLQRTVHLQVHFYNNCFYQKILMDA